jgi:hypothetical protein
VGAGVDADPARPRRPDGGPADVRDLAAFPQTEVHQRGERHRLGALVLESLDYAFRDNRVDKDRPEFELLPSEYFHRQVKVCFGFEETAPQRLLDKIGCDNVLFETDYPHAVCLTRQQLREALDNLSTVEPADRQKVLYGNAVELYGVLPEIIGDDADQAVWS